MRTIRRHLSDLSAPVRLAGFLAILALVFGGAVAAGKAVGPTSDSKPVEPEHGMGGMDEDGGATAQRVRGLAVSDGGLTLRLASTAATRGERAPLRFRVTGADGRTVRDFDVEHTKRMHLIVVRRDLTGFQHLHPVQAPDGTWSVPLRLTDAGTYRVMADFSHDGTPRTLAADLQVDGAVRSRALPAPAATAPTADGYTVRLTAGASRAGVAGETAFTVTRDGRPVTVEPYLGAQGHLVALREGDLAFLHVHPHAERLAFETTFPTAGRYRLFLQFKAAGAVHTAAFSRAVGA